MGDKKADLPNLLVIGAMKAGTTSFHEMLNQHPDIFMSEVKEINFFAYDDLWEKGLDWYQSHFKLGSQYKIRGESSVNYTKNHRFKNVPKRIYEVLNRDVKLIYILRDPIDRFRSNFTDSKTYGDIPPDLSINGFVLDRDTNENPLALTGKYYEQISSFLKFFNKDQMLFIEFERLINEMPDVMGNVCEFLSVSKWDFIMRGDNRSETKSYDSAISIKLKAIKKMIPRQWRTYMPTPKTVQKLLRTTVDSQLNLPDVQTEEILRAFYAKEIIQLQEIFNFRPKYWREYH